MKKSEIKKNLGRKIALALGVGMFSLLPLVQALPAGGQSESATIKVSGSTMDISGAANNVINWQAFSIAKGETVNFDAGNYLNLVKGPDVSNIYGTLKGAGNIFLVNPNGIVFGNGAVINVGSLTASTAPISSVDTKAFLNGNLNIITGSVTEGSDISMALVNVEAANSLVLNAGEVVLQNTAVLDKVTSVTGATDVIIGADGALALTGGQTLKLSNVQNVNRATLVTDLSQITDMSGTYLLAGDVTAGNGFTPIGAVEEDGSLTDKGFTGYFNGLGYKVSGLNVDMRSNELYFGGIGLFSSIGSAVTDFETSETSYKPGFVKNLNIENASVAGGVDNWSHVGGLTGFVRGGSLVSNVAVSGSVSGYYAAGIAGAIQDGSAKLTNVSNAAAISGVEAGGIVAAAMADAVTIEDAKNTGSVTGKTYVGGIVGLLEGIHTAKLSNVYNTGAVTAEDGGTYSADYVASAVGGIVGSASVAQEGTLTITNAYSSGQIVAGDLFTSEWVFDESGSHQVIGDTPYPNTNVGGIVGSATVTEADYSSSPLTNVGSELYYLQGSVKNSTGSIGGTAIGTALSASDLQAKINAVWGGSAASGTDTPSSEPTTPTTPTDTPTTPSTEPTTPTTPTTPTADSQSGSSSRMDVIRDILTELMGSNMSSEQRRSMERDTENNIVAATSNPGRGDRPMAAMPTADTGAAAPAGDSSIVENTDKSASTGGEVNSNDNEDEN